MSDTVPVISFSDLHRSYGQLNVLKVVTLSAKRGNALYYGRYFVDKTLNPFVPYPILAGCSITLTLIVIWIYGWMNQRRSRHLPQNRRIGLKLRLNVIR